MKPSIVIYSRIRIEEIQKKSRTWMKRRSVTPSRMLH